MAPPEGADAHPGRRDLLDLRVREASCTPAPPVTLGSPGGHVTRCAICRRCLQALSMACSPPRPALRLWGLLCRQRRQEAVSTLRRACPSQGLGSPATGGLGDRAGEVVLLCAHARGAAGPVPGPEPPAHAPPAHPRKLRPGPNTVGLASPLTAQETRVRALSGQPPGHRSRLAPCWPPSPESTPVV